MAVSRGPPEVAKSQILGWPEVAESQVLGDLRILGVKTSMSANTLCTEICV